jgi:hypothetical protein
MSSDPNPDADPAPDPSGGHQPPSQEQYEAETADSRWVELQDGDGSFRVREIAPLKLLRDMRTFGVDGLLGASDDDDVDMQELLAGGDFAAFIEETVLPNVIRPDCYWADIGDGDFDLAALTPDDLMVVVTGMTGQDPAELDERMDETFRG